MINPMSPLLVRLNRAVSSPLSSPGYGFSDPKKVYLLDWWLVKAQDKGIGICGWSRRGLAGKIFHSTAIVKRHDTSTLETSDGFTVSLSGFINRHRTQENGFPFDVCSHFLVGFPCDWEEYAARYADEEMDGRSTHTEHSGVKKFDACQEMRNTLVSSGLSILDMGDILMYTNRDHDGQVLRKHILSAAMDKLNSVLDKIPVNVKSSAVRNTCNPDNAVATANNRGPEEPETRVFEVTMIEGSLLSDKLRVKSKKSKMENKFGDDDSAGDAAARDIEGLQRPVVETRNGVDSEQDGTLTNAEKSTAGKRYRNQNAGSAGTDGGPDEVLLGTDSALGTVDHKYTSHDSGLAAADMSRRACTRSMRKLGSVKRVEVDASSGVPSSKDPVSDLTRDSQHVSSCPPSNEDPISEPTLYDNCKGRITETARSALLVNPSSKDPIPDPTRDNQHVSSSVPSSEEPISEPTKSRRGRKRIARTAQSALPVIPLSNEPVPDPTRGDQHVSSSVLSSEDPIVEPIQSNKRKRRITGTAQSAMPAIPSSKNPVSDPKSPDNQQVATSAHLSGDSVPVPARYNNNKRRITRAAQSDMPAIALGEDRVPVPAQNDNQLIASSVPSSEAPVAVPAQYNNSKRRITRTAQSDLHVLALGVAVPAQNGNQHITSSAPSSEAPLPVPAQYNNSKRRITRTAQSDLHGMALGVAVPTQNGNQHIASSAPPSEDLDPEPAQYNNSKRRITRTAQRHLPVIPSGEDPVSDPAPGNQRVPSSAPSSEKPQYNMSKRMIDNTAFPVSPCRRSSRLQKAS